MKVDLSKCKELTPGVFQKTGKTFYVKDAVTGKLLYCNQEKISKLVAKYGSIENVGKQHTAKKTTKTAKKENGTKKDLVRSSAQAIEAVLINDSGEKVATFSSAPVSQEGNKILYSFDDAKFKHGFIFVLKLNEKLFHPTTKSFKEVKVKLFNGHTEETYDAVYDPEEDYYCVLDCDAAVQLLSIAIEH